MSTTPPSSNTADLFIQHIESTQNPTDIKDLLAAFVSAMPTHQNLDRDSSGIGNIGGISTLLLFAHRIMDFGDDRNSLQVAEDVLDLASCHLDNASNRIADAQLPMSSPEAIALYHTYEQSGLGWLRLVKIRKNLDTTSLDPWDAAGPIIFAVTHLCLGPNKSQPSYPEALKEAIELQQKIKALHAAQKDKAEGLALTLGLQDADFTTSSAPRIALAAALQRVGYRRVELSA